VGEVVSCFFAAMSHLRSAPFLAEWNLCFICVLFLFFVYCGVGVGLCWDFVCVFHVPFRFTFAEL